jgi:hypothetical protein
MNSVGKFANTSISAVNFSTAPRNHPSVRWIAAAAAGIIPRIRSRFSALSASFTPPGTVHPG